MRWVAREAAKHLTPARLRQRIARAREHLQALNGAGFSPETAKARENHGGLIEVLSERLVPASRCKLALPSSLCS